MADEVGHRAGRRLRLHGADVLRYGGAPGVSVGLSGGLSFGCDGNAVCAEQRRVRLGLRSARAVMVAMAMKFGRVRGTEDWIAANAIA